MQEISTSTTSRKCTCKHPFLIGLDLLNAIPASRGSGSLLPCSTGSGAELGKHLLWPADTAEVTQLEQSVIQAHDQLTTCLGEALAAAPHKLLIGDWLPPTASTLEGGRVRIPRSQSLASAAWSRVSRYHGYTQDGMTHLYPEEAVYLREIGLLDIRYRGLPLSLQQAYNSLLVTGDTSFANFLVFGHLSRAGYIVRRHDESAEKPSLQPPTVDTTYWIDVSNRPVFMPEVVSSTDTCCEGPAMVGSGEGLVPHDPSQSAADIMTRLADFSADQQQPLATSSHLPIVYDVYSNPAKPGFSKRRATVPTYQVSISAQCDLDCSVLLGVGGGDASNVSGASSLSLSCRLLAVVDGGEVVLLQLADGKPVKLGFQFEGS